MCTCTNNPHTTGREYFMFSQSDLQFISADEGHQSCVSPRVSLRFSERSWKGVFCRCIRVKELLVRRTRCPCLPQWNDCSGNSHLEKIFKSRLYSHFCVRLLPGSLLSRFPLNRRWAHMRNSRLRPGGWRHYSSVVRTKYLVVQTVVWMLLKTREYNTPIPVERNSRSP